MLVPLAVSSQKKTRVAGGSDPGGVYCLRGAWGKLCKFCRGVFRCTRCGDSTILVHVLGGHDADLAQVFVGEEDFVHAVGGLAETQARLTGQLEQFIFRQAEQQGRTAMRYIFVFLRLHGSSLRYNEQIPLANPGTAQDGRKAMPSCSTA